MEEPSLLVLEHGAAAACQWVAPRPVSLGRAQTHGSSPPDDSASAASSMEVTDRIASLEQRVQMQEDDIQLLKSALADVVRRLNITEEQQAVLSRKGPTKGGHCGSCGGRGGRSPRRPSLWPMRGSP